eukprot:767823_1
MATRIPLNMISKHPYIHGANNLDNCGRLLVRLLSNDTQIWSVDSHLSTANECTLPPSTTLTTSCTNTRTLTHFLIDLNGASISNRHKYIRFQINLISYFGGGRGWMYDYIIRCDE